MNSEAEILISKSLHTINQMICPHCGGDHMMPMGAGWLICIPCDTLFDEDEVLELLTNEIKNLSPQRQVERDRRLSKGLPG